MQITKLFLIVTLVVLQVQGVPKLKSEMAFSLSSEEELSYKLSEIQQDKVTVFQFIPDFELIEEGEKPENEDEVTLKQLGAI